VIESEHPLKREYQETTEIEFKKANGIEIIFDKNCELPAPSDEHILIKIKSKDGEIIAEFTKKTKQYKYTTKVLFFHKKTNEIKRQLI
jgi:hypothetical protein